MFFSFIIFIKTQTQQSLTLCINWRTNRLRINRDRMQPLELVTFDHCNFTPTYHLDVYHPNIPHRYIMIHLSHYKPFHDPLDSVSNAAPTTDYWIKSSIIRSYNHIKAPLLTLRIIDDILAWRMIIPEHNVFLCLDYSIFAAKFTFHLA